MAICTARNCDFPVFQEGRCIFHCAKEHKWYEEKKDANGNIYRDWTPAKHSEWITKFWHAIREEKMAKEDYNFSDYIFPEFETADIRCELGVEEDKNEREKQYANKDMNFWKRNEELLFRTRVSFISARFLERVEFWSAQFNGPAIFLEAQFVDKAYFGAVRFLGDVNFMAATFFGEVIFINGEFFADSTFHCTKFLGKTTFKKVQFSGKADFSHATFSGNDQTLFEQVSFQLHASDLETAAGSFRNVFFPASVVFRQCDLSRVSFWDADIELTKFFECDFGYLKPVFKINREEVGFERTHNRKVLWDSSYVTDKKDASCKDFENVETRYRQFKKNFEDRKDWETAGDFYHGEMLMRLRKYCAERDEKVVEPPWWPPFWIWNRIFYNRGRTFFLRWYKWISDFNESPMRALLWLVGFIVVFSGIFWWRFQGPAKEWEMEDLKSAGESASIPSYSSPKAVENGGILFWLFRSRVGAWRTEKAISFGVTGAIPLYGLPADVEKGVFNGEFGIATKWILDAEIFLSTIVWTLLVLSVRQKFRR